MKYLNLVIAPFKKKIKMQLRINTLEVKYKELEEILHSEPYKKIVEDFKKELEIERLIKENHRLRIKLKELRKEGQK